MLEETLKRYKGKTRDDAITDLYFKHRESIGQIYRDVGETFSEIKIQHADEVEKLKEDIEDLESAIDYQQEKIKGFGVGKVGGYIDYKVVKEKLGLVQEINKLEENIEDLESMIVYLVEFGVFAEKIDIIQAVAESEEKISGLELEVALMEEEIKNLEMHKHELLKTNGELGMELMRERDKNSFF